MIVKKLRMFGVKPQKPFILFLSIFLCAQTLTAINPNTPHTDINHQTIASTKNSKQSNYITQNYKKILKDIALGAADSSIAIALFNQILSKTIALKDFEQPENPIITTIKLLAYYYGLIAHLLPIITFRKKHKDKSADIVPILLLTTPFFIPLISFMLVKNAFGIGKHEQTNWDYISEKIESYYEKIISYGMAPIMSFYSKQIDSPTSYAIGALLAAAAFFTIKFGHKPIL